MIHPQSLQLIVNDDLFWDDADVVLAFVEPITEAIAHLEKDQCYSSL